MNTRKSFTTFSPFFVTLWLFFTTLWTVLWLFSCLSGTHRYTCTFFKMTCQFLTGLPIISPYWEWNLLLNDVYGVTNRPVYNTHWPFVWRKYFQRSKSDSYLYISDTERHYGYHSEFFILFRRVSAFERATARRNPITVCHSRSTNLKRYVKKNFKLHCVEQYNNPEMSVLNFFLVIVTRMR